MLKSFRRYLIAGLLLTLMSSSYADISVNLKCTGPFYFPSSPTLLPAGALVQLIWSADEVYSGFGGSVTPYSSEAVAGDYSAYGDYQLWSGVTPVNGGWGGDLDGLVDYADGDVGDVDINAGYVFLYVFQDGTPSGTDFFIRSTIYDTSTFGVAESDPKPTPDDVSLGNMTLNTYQLQVPEPGTLALMGMGLAVAGIARRKRKNV